MKKQQSKKLIWFYVVFGVIARLIPHPANVTPTTNLCLFSGAKLPKYIAIPVMLVLLAISDIFLAKIYGYPVFSSWSLFSYSGFAAIVFFSSKLGHEPGAKKLFLFLFASTLGYWTWTNFGVWLCGFYPRSLIGLESCFIAGLPFLRNALIGNLVWMVVIWGSFVTVEKLRHCEG